MRIAFVLLALASASAVAAQAPPPVHDVASALFGTWEVREIPAELSASLRAGCDMGTMEFRPDHTYVAASEGLTMTGYFVAEEHEGALLLTQQVTGHNGGENCQGLRAEYVVAHNVPRLYVSVEGDTLRYYLGDEPSGLHIVLVRRAHSP